MIIVCFKPIGVSFFCKTQQKIVKNVGNQGVVTELVPIDFHSLKNTIATNTMAKLKATL